MSSLICSLMLLVISSVSCFASEVPDSYNIKINSLNFYPSGAKFEFVIENLDNDGNFEAYLPGAFQPESVKLINPQDVYGDIHVEKLSRTRWTPKNLLSLRAEQENQTKLISALTSQQSALEQTLSLLKNVTPQKSDNPQNLLDYIVNAQSLRQETENSLSEIKSAITQERDKLTMINSELNSRRPAGENSYLVITGRAKNNVVIEAFTSSANWRPKYILNLNSDSGDIDVQMFVRASQRTGLDYSGLITLHTRTPDENISNPDLLPIKVGIKPKTEKILSTSAVSINRTNRMYKSVQMEAPMMMEDAVFDEDMIDGGMENALGGVPALTESLSDRTVNLKAEINGDGKEREFEVDSPVKKLFAKPIIMLIPEQRNNAWIIADMNEDNEKLIPGTADLRVDNYSTGKIYIQEFGEGQKQIPFGYADQITIKKEALIGKIGVSWFSGVFTSGYKLEINNGTKYDRTITIKDRLPVPTDEKIKLDIKRIEPQQKERDAENRFTWEITVPSGKTETIIVDYTLSYPSGEELEYK